MDVSGIGIDVDGGMLGDGTRGKLADRIQLTTFKLFQLMTDKTTSPTAAAMRTQRWTGILLLSIDFVQILGILLATDFGWPKSAFDWTKYLGIFSELLPLTSKSFFLFSFSVACTFVAISAAVTTYVWISAWKGRYNTIWPLKVLRVLVTTIVTFGFIPLTKVLLQPLDCTGLAVLMGDADLADGANCYSGPTAALVVLSILSVIFLVPFALFMQLVYFDDSPQSGSPSCKPSGRADAMHTVVRASLTAMAIFMDNLKAMRAFISCLLFSYLLFNVCLRLPYYRLAMSRARAAQYALFAWLSFSAALLSSSGGSEATPSSPWFFIAISSLVLAPIPALFASTLPVFRYNQLALLAKSIPLAAGNTSNQAIASASPTAHLLSPSGASRLDTMPSVINRLMHVPGRQSAAVQPDRVEENPPTQDSLRSLLDNTDDAGDQAIDQHSPKEGLERARSEPDTSNALYDRSSESQPPISENAQGFQYRIDTDAIDDVAAEWLAHAVRKYWVLESDTEVMARTLLKPEAKTMKSLQQIDQFGALQQLREASRSDSSIDLAFQIFKKLQAWYQNRQKEEVGAAVDSLSLIQFKKYFSEAQQHHHGAVSGLNSLWRALYDRRVSSKANVDHDKLVFLLNKLSLERKLAEKSYQLALEKFPLSRKLLRSYSLFQLHVENDLSLSKALLTRVSEIESVDVNELRSMAGQTRVTGNTGGLSDNMSRNSDSVSYTPSSNGGSTTSAYGRGRRKRSGVRRDETIEVARHMVWFRVSIVLLLCCSIGIFIASKNVTESFAKSLESMDSAGLRRKLTASSFYFARGMQLAALNNDSSSVDSMRTALLKEMQTLDSKHSDLFYNGQNVPEVYDLYRNEILEAQISLPERPDKTLRLKYGLWDLGNLLVSNAVQVAQYSMEKLRKAPDQSEWRFIMDNSRRLVIPAFDEAVGFYQEYDTTTAYVGGIINATLLSAMVLITIFLVWFVFQPILIMVYSSKKSVLEIIDTVPTNALRVLRHRYKRMLALYARLERTNGDDTELTTESKLFAITIHNIDPSISKAAVAQEEQELTDSEKDDEDANSVSSLQVDNTRSHSQVLKGLQTPSVRKIEIPSELQTFAAGGDMDSCSGLSDGTPKTLQPAALDSSKPRADQEADKKHTPADLSSYSGQTSASAPLAADGTTRSEDKTDAVADNTTPNRQQRGLKNSVYRPTTSGSKRGLDLADPPQSSTAGARTKSRSSMGTSSYSIRSIQKKTHLFFVDNQICPKDKRVRRLALIMMLAVTTLVALYASSFAVTLTIFERGQFTSAELNNAGRRRYLAREVINSARELMIGDPSQGSTPELSAVLRDEIAYYRRIHNGLRSGDKGLSLPGSERRYPERDALMFGKPGAFEVKGSLYDALVAQGVHDMLLAYWTDAEDVLARFSNTSLPRIGLDWSRLRADPTLATMLRLESSNLGSGLGAAVKLYKKEGTEIIEDLNQQEDIILGINIAVIALLYLLLFRQAVAEVDSELRRREDVLLLLPSAVVQKTRGLKKFFVQTEN